MSFLREEIKKAFAQLGEKECALLDCIQILVEDNKRLEKDAELGQLVRRMPEGLGVVKNMQGFCSIKRMGSSENDEWHTGAGIFLNPEETIKEVK